MSFHKTEKPTPKRRLKAREQGQTLRCRELASASALICSAFLVAREIPEIRADFLAMMSSALLPGGGSALLCARAALPIAVKGVLLPAVAALACAIAVLWLQSPNVQIAPKNVVSFARLSLVSNATRIFSAETCFRVLKTSGFGLVIAYQGWQAVRELVSTAASPGRLSHGAAVVSEFLMNAACLIACCACLDYMIERRRHEASLKMTKQEIRQEARENEGDPLLKARMRRLQRQVRRRRMLQDVQKATLVVVNPTHFSVAIEYRPEIRSLPIVLAKGVDSLAHQIREIAVWNGIPVVESRQLARDVFRSCQLGDPIPKKLYTAMAQVLAFVYRTDAKLQARMRAESQT